VPPSDRDPLDYAESSRGEREAPDAEAAADFADQVERLEGNSRAASDATGQSGPGGAHRTSEDDDDPDGLGAGRDADRPGGESGDARNN
jgi:hypothetical protein